MKQFVANSDILGACTVTSFDAANGERLVVFEWEDGSVAWGEVGVEQVRRWRRDENMRAAREKRYGR